MLKVHLSDGQTLVFDLHSSDQASLWLERASSRDFQRQISGLTIAHNGVSHSIRRPADLDSVFMFAEPVLPDADRGIKGGNRIIVTAGEVSLSMMVHADQRASRIDLSRPGRSRFNPKIR